jgi:uncharacterized protein YbjT (DUF2867 family)
MILVCGATGTIGGEVLRHLMEANVPATALVREPPSVKSHLPEGVPYRVGDLSRKETLPEALHDITKLFLVSAVGDHQTEQEENLIAAAANSGVSHVVKLSVMGAAEDAAFGFGRVHAQIESTLKKSGMHWTMLRPNMLMQNLRWYQSATKQGTLPLALKDAAVSHVDASDIGAAAFRALTEDGHAGKTYTLTGPQALTGSEVAAAMAEATKHPVQYVAISIADLRASLEKLGDSPRVVDAEAELFELWSRGAGSEVTTTVEDVTGKKPVSMADFATRHAAELG